VLRNNAIGNCVELKVGLILGELLNKSK